MRHVLNVAVLALASLGCATTTSRSPSPVETGGDPAPAPPAVPMPRDPSSTVYRFEGAEVVGSRRHPREALLAVVGMPAAAVEIDLAQQSFWDGMAASKSRLEAAFAFAHCRYNLVAFPPTGLARITVDVVDAGDEWRLDFLPERTGEIADPDGLLAAWEAYEKEKWELRRQGELPLARDPICRALGCVADFGHPRLAELEETFLQGVPRNHAALVRLLREDRDPARRMIAASLLVYGTSRSESVAALLPSVRDPDHGVRNEVLRSLGELQHGQTALVVPLDPILEALWYPSTNDRNKAGWALVRIVEATGKTHRRRILERGGEMLAMMAGLQTPTDREPAIKVLEALSHQQHGADEPRWKAWLASQGIPPRARLSSDR